LAPSDRNKVKRKRDIIEDGGEKSKIILPQQSFVDSFALAVASGILRHGDSVEG
jgi:hypothetical protein